MVYLFSLFRFGLFQEIFSLLALILCTCMLTLFSINIFLQSCITRCWLKLQLVKRSFCVVLSVILHLTLILWSILVLYIYAARHIQVGPLQYPWSTLTSKHLSGGRDRLPILSSKIYYKKLSTFLVLILAIITECKWRRLAEKSKSSSWSNDLWIEKDTSFEAIHGLNFMINKIKWERIKRK